MAVFMMSKDIIVLTPNGRRQKIHCTPDTRILQVLEDVCEKHGFQASEYDLKHHNHVLDLTTTIRFSNLPNKAFLEMVEADKKRQESNVIIGLTLEDGERRTAEYSPNISLYEILNKLANKELQSLTNPTIVYMRQEVNGTIAMRDTTLRKLGLIGGRAVLRLIDKPIEPIQANVSTVYRSQIMANNSMDNVKDDVKQNTDSKNEKPSTSQEPMNKEDKIINALHLKTNETLQSNVDIEHENKNIKPTEEPMDIDNEATKQEICCTNKAKQSGNHVTQESLERRLNIENEVTFIGDHKAVAFTHLDGAIEHLEDLPDDFYDLSVDEVRRLYNDLQKQRAELENAPLVTSNIREELQKKNTEKVLNEFKHVVVRVQFPDNIILQGIFQPTDTIEDVHNFIKQHLQNPEQSFQIYTTPIKEIFDPKTTLHDAKFVPCVHMHFKWIECKSTEPCLKPSVYDRQTSSEAASILASKYRAPSRRKSDESLTKPSSSGSASTSKNTKVPKWFKN